MLACEKVAQLQERPQFAMIRLFDKEAKKAWTVSRIVDMMAMRGPHGLIQAINDWALGGWSVALRPTVRTVMASGEATATAGVQVAPDVVQKYSVRFNFDEVDQNSVLAARNFRNNLITQVTSDTASSIQIAVADGIARGKSPEYIAQRIRMVLTLSPRQAQALINYANGLEARQASMLAREVNAGVEDEVRERWAADKPITQTQLATLVSDYSLRLLDQRATTIARTETLRAANLGAELSMRQAQDEGLFGELELRRFWLDTNDAKTRPEHKEVPRLNPQGVALDEPFVYPGGRTIARPGDPNAEASMTINCRCTVVYRLVRRR